MTGPPGLRIGAESAICRAAAQGTVQHATRCQFRPAWNHTARDPPGRLPAARLPGRERRAFVRSRPGGDTGSIPDDGAAQCRVDGHRRAAVARRRGVDAGARGTEWRGTWRQSLPCRGWQTAHPRHAGLRHAGDRDTHRAEGQHRALRALHLERQLLHPMRGGRLPPHHIFSRSPRRDGALHHHHHRRCDGRADHAVEWQSGRDRGRRQRPPPHHLD